MIDEAMAQALAAEESTNGDWVKDERYSTKEYYSDTDVSIDIKRRTIGDVSENISTVGENNAQYISFTMDRYIDGVDLKDMLIQLQAEASENIGIIDEPVNVYYNETHIRFGWSIPQDITQQATTIKIIVFCTGTLSDGNAYTIKTLPLSYEVKDTLVIGDFVPQPNKNWYLQFVNAMDEKVTKATTAATTATQNAEKIEVNILLAQESAEIATQKAAEADASAIEVSEAASIVSLKATEVSANVSTVQESERNAKLSETNAKTSENNAAASLDDVKVIEANVIALASNASDSADVAIQKASDASIYANNANASANVANTHATTSDAKAKEASSFAILAESYAHGSTNVREDENIDNAKYYYEQTKQITQGFNGIVNMGTISFEELPSVEIRTNAMYNINNSFISDERFKDGGGIFYGAGNNVVWTVEEKWDVLASSNVIGVKGAKETVYRQGNVEITPENIGALPVDGNAASATKAEQDSDGNVITKTYAKQADLPTKVSELENDSGYATDEELKKTTELVALNKQTLGYNKKNLLKVGAVTSTSNGIIYTVNADKSITANGTATADSGKALGTFIPTPNMEYIFTANEKVPTDGLWNNACYIKGIDASDVWFGDSTGKNFIPKTNNLITCYIYIKKGTTVNNLTFYPMIRSAEITDGTYEPYVDDVDTRLNAVKTEIEEIPDTYATKTELQTLTDTVGEVNALLDTI